ncbi:MAG: amino acid adenylation domain-containing protein [bacterium]|nr:amino acid adenylation domain-containing protein [bacterium]
MTYREPGQVEGETPSQAATGGRGDAVGTTTWPVSWSQSGILFDSELLSGGQLYKVPFVLRWTGELDVERLRRSLRLAADRHVPLRISLGRHGGEWRQSLHPPAGLDLEQLDSGSEATTAAVVADFVDGPFDLSQPPLARALLVREGIDRHVLALVFHHAICDRWSLQVLLRDVETAYAGGTFAGPIDDAFMRFCRDQRTEVAAGRLDASERYWVDLLRDAPAVTELALPARSRSQEYTTDRLTVRERWADDLAAAARQTGTTVPGVFAAAVVVLLARLSRNGDVVVGMPVAGRGAAGTEHAFGNFVNTVAIRLDATEATSLREAIVGTGEQLLGAYEHQHYPFARLVSKLGRSRRTGAHPVFQHLVDWSDESPTCTLPGCATDVLTLPPHPSPFDLSVVATRDGDEVEVVFEFVEHLRESLDVIVAGLGAVVREFGRDLDRAIADIKLDEPAIVRGPLARSGSVVERLRSRYWGTPAAVALVDGEVVVTFGELGDRVRSLAERLQAADAGPGKIVAIEMPRGLAFVTAVLAALEVGAAFAPLDPADPPSRREGQLAELGALVRLAAGPSGDVTIRRHEDTYAGVPRDASPDTAYVIMTSGSTGRPRPVAVGRAALENHVAWTIDHFRLTPADRVLQFCSVAFDAAIEEILPALCAGASIALRSEEMAYSVDAFLDGCERIGATVLDLPTSFWAQLGGDLAARSDSLPGPIRLVVCGGERAHAAALRAWATVDARDAVSRRFLNTYGPTEATVVVTSAELALGGDDAPAIDPPIGRPVSGVAAYVLDDTRRPVPVGMIGTLFLGGACVADGYLGRPADTAARFVPDPFSTEAGARMFDTGDLVWLDRDGVLHYEGRGDRQMKLQGHRVEPGEIESVLLSHPRVAEAAVVADDGAPIAAVVLRGDEPMPDLRAHVSRRMPAHMCPVRFVALPAVPVNARGKVDQWALRAEVAEADKATAAHDRPMGTAGDDGLAGGVVETMRAVFARELGDRTIGPDDDFFELGGHSLAALRIVEALASAGLVLDVAHLLRGRTIRAMAPHAIAVESAGPRPTAVEDARGTGRDASPTGEPGAYGHALTDTQLGIWIDENLVEGPSPYGIIGAFRSDGPIDPVRLEAAIRRALDDVPIVRSSIVERDGELRCVARSADRFELVVDGSTATDVDGAARVARALAAAPIDVAEDLWLRATLVVSDVESPLLVTYLHHLAADRETERLLLEQVAAHYDGTPPEDLTDFFDVVGRDRPEPSDRDWWQTTLAGSRLDLDLPLDRRPGRRRRADGTAVASILPEPTARAFERSGTELGATPFAVFAAAATAWLRRLTGTDDVVVGVAASRRTGDHTTGTAVLGPLIDVLPLRSAASGAETVRGCVDDVGDRLIQMLTRRPIAARELRRLWPRIPDGMYRVLLDWEDEPDERPVRFGASEVRRIPTPVTTSRADLEIGLRPVAGRYSVEMRGRSEVLERATLQSWADSFAHFLTAALADHDAVIAGLPMVAPSARRPATGDAGGEQPAALSRLLAQTFSAHRDRIAIVHGDKELTYGALDRAADSVASSLGHLPAGSTVGILFERGPDLAAGVIGTWRAGHTCAMLDPVTPLRRLAGIVATVEPATILTAGSTGPLADQLGVRMTPVRSTVDTTATPRSSRPLPGPAYVCLTSGSTGAPKAVACAELGLVRLLTWSTGAIPLGPDDVFLHIASPGFDIALWEMLHPLLSGARLIILPSDRSGDVGAVAELIDTHRVTALHAVPSVLAGLLDELEAHDASTVRQLVCGGERLSPSLAARALSRLNADLHHTYGPTEAAVFVERWPVAEPFDLDVGLPLGSPVAGTDVMVLDQLGQHLPDGALGEICVSGDSLAHGYLGQGGATAASFTPNPYGPPGARLYRTGDRGRIRPDGSLECLGRVDRQVKIAGVRVEPGEVEAHLLAHPLIAETVVVPRERPDGGLRLVAYLVPTDPLDEVDQLRSFLRERLPNAFVPATFVPLDRLDRTPNGKIDVAALPPPPEVVDDVVAPARTAIEEELLAVWRSVLSRSNIGVHSDFFELGGDSIAAIRVVARASTAGIAITLADLFRSPTVAQLADLAGPPALEIGATAVATPGTHYPTPSPNQAVLLAEHRGTESSFSQSMALDVGAPIEPEVVLRALHAVVRHHAALRQRFRVEDGQAVTSVCDADAPEDRLLSFSAGPIDDPDDVRQAIELHLDVEHGPTVAALYDTRSPGRRLMIVVHHLAIDMVAWHVFVDDLAEAITCLDGGVEPDLPPPSCSIERFASTTARLEPTAVDRQRWAAQLDQTAIAQPVAGCRCDVATSIPPDVAARLRDRAGELDLPFDLLVVAAAVLVFARWRERSHVSVLLEAHGRDRTDIDLSRMVGWVAPSYPVRPMLPPDPTLADSIAATSRALDLLPADKHGYLALRARRDPSIVGRPHPVLAVNYLGSSRPGGIDHLLRLSANQPRDGTDEWRPVGGEVAAVEVATEADGCLHIAWEADSGALDDGALTALAASMRRELEGFAATAERVRVAAPLTPLQAGMLSRSLAMPGRGLYHTQVHFEIDGDVADAEFESAWRDVADVADAFRTAFRWTDVDHPRQFVEPTAALDWRCHDVAPDRLESEWEAMLAHDRQTEFDLTTPPLSRLHMVRAGSLRRLLWSHHHLLFDGWSLPLVTTLVERAYRHRVEGGPPLPALPSHLAFVDWVATQPVRESERFWADRLAGLERPTLLGADAPAGRPGFATVTLNAASTAALRTLAKRRRTTMNVLVLSAWTLVLRERVDHDDIVVGVVVSLRPPEIPDVDQLVGLCMNTVPIRVDVSDDRSFGDVTAQVAEQILDAYPHAHVPLSRSLASIPTGSEAFDSLFVFENYPGDRSGQPLGRHARLTVLGSVESTEYPWTLIALPDDSLTLELHHRGSPIDASRATGMLEQLRTVLDTLAGSR